MFVAALGLFCSPVWAADDMGKEKMEEGEKTKIPNTAPEIWKEVLTQQEALSAIIKEKKLSEVHKTAFTIRDLVNALPGKSKELSAEKLERVQSAGKQVEKLASSLDETGDANDQPGTEANFKKLQGVLKLIEAQYPVGILGAKEAASYSCPMHQEVVSNSPGKCPKCGMNLTKK